MASCKALLVHAGFHALVLLIIVPACYLAISAVFGCLLAAVESWRAIDGLLYVGGNLVLIPLTDLVPKTVGGKAVDVIVSISTFGSLGWGLSILGLMPFCAGTQGFLDSATSRCHRGRPGLASFLTTSGFTVLLWPLVSSCVSLFTAMFLVAAEGWTYPNSVLRCLGVMSHVPSLGPKAHSPSSDAGKIVILLNAFVGLGFCLGWTVGVFLVLPGLGIFADLLDTMFKATSSHVELTGFEHELALLNRNYYPDKSKGADTFWSTGDDSSEQYVLCKMHSKIPTWKWGIQSATLFHESEDNYVVVCARGNFEVAQAWLTWVKGDGKDTWQKAPKVRATAHGPQGQGMMAKTITFCIVVLAIVPLIVLPLSLVLGAVLNKTEGWGSVTTGMLYVGGNIISLPLSPVVPTSTSGKVVDFIVSCIGVGCFGFLIAVIGAVDFTDKCCEALGGKIEGRVPALKFTLKFYLVVMPVICILVSVPFGGILAAAEGWGFGDGIMSALSVLASAPSLAPPNKWAQSGGGKFIVFLLGCYALCVTIGWGAGLVVASKGMDTMGDRISDIVAKMMSAAGVSEESKSAEGASPEAPAPVAEVGPALESATV